MLKNYITTTITNLITHKLYSVINILGLAIGLASCLVIALYVHDETSYDKHWGNAERIYRLNTAINMTGNETTKVPATALPALPAMKRYFADEIEFTSRVMSLSREVTFGDFQFQESIASVDKEFIEIFDLEVLAGSLKTTLEGPAGIALSTELAAKIFGRQDVLGQVLTVNTLGVNADYQVTAVYRLPEGNTVLDLPAFTLLNESTLPPSFNNWIAINFWSYLQLKSGIDIKQINSRLLDFTDQNVDISPMMAGPDVKPSDRIRFDLQNISELHLNSPFDETRAGGNKTAVMAFAAISVLVLLIGSINFMILSTAKATQRAKEVAMRKVVGAKRRQLVVQFLGESIFIVILSTLISLALVELMLPFFESLVGRNLDVSYSSPATILSLLLLGITVGIIGGLYPAFVLSNFRPADTLKTSRPGEMRGSSVLRNAMVVFQFSISITLIVAAIVIFAQVKYTANRDPGFNKENILIINDLLLRPGVNPQRNSLKQQIAGLSNVTNVALSAHQPGQQLGLAATAIPFKISGTSGSSLPLPALAVDYNFFKTYKIPFVSGRDYSEDRDQHSQLLMQLIQPGAQPADSTLNKIIINVSAARRLGIVDLEDAIGRQISSTNSTSGYTYNFSIIGIVADTHFFSLNAVPRAETYILEPGFGDVLSIRFQNEPQKILSQVSKVWKSVMGDAEMSFSFVDQLMAEEFKQEQLEARVLISFSLLAIIVACLGLYGMASFTVERRTKEIGLRKVMGAKVKTIVKLLLWQFSKPVLLANFIAWPVAVWIMLNWLERFPYQIALWLLGPFCLMAGLIALSIAWLTVISNTTRVARSSPIHSLRYE